MASTVSVSTVWRYPVKSMIGEELNASAIGAAGVFGDRAFALVDEETGKVVSAKNPLKWPDLFAYRAAYAAPPQSAPLPAVWITLPSGDIVRSDAPDAGEKLSASLGRAVSLRALAPQSASLEQFWPEHAGQDNEVSQEAVAGDAPPGTFFDYAAVHLLTTSSIDALRAVYPQGRLEVRRFRPNIVVDTAGQAGFVENGWVGKTIKIGGVRLQISDPCPRCVMPTLAQGDLPRDPGLFVKAIAHNKVHVPFAGRALPSVGVYARVLEGGVIRRGDAVEIEA